MITVAVLSALHKESSALFELPGTAPRIEYGIEWALRNIGEVRLAIACAGMGTINTAAGAQFLIDHFKPDMLILCGIAGSLNPRLGMGDVVIGAHLEQLDADMQIIAESAPQLTSFTSDKHLVAVAEQELEARGFLRQAALRELEGRRSIKLERQSAQKPRFVTGTIATSDLFSTDATTLNVIKSRYHADCEEMEGAAAAQICARAALPFLAIRTISNICGEAYTDLDQRKADLITTARALAEITLGIVQRLDK